MGRTRDTMTKAEWKRFRRMLLAYLAEIGGKKEEVWEDRRVRMDSGGTMEVRVRVETKEPEFWFPTRHGTLLVRPIDPGPGGSGMIHCRFQHPVLLPERHDAEGTGKWNFYFGREEADTALARFRSYFEEVLVGEPADNAARLRRKEAAAG